MPNPSPIPTRLRDFAVLCTRCTALIPLVSFVVDGRPHAQCRCPGCGAVTFLHRR